MATFRAAGTRAITTATGLMPFMHPDAVPRSPIREHGIVLAERRFGPAAAERLSAALAAVTDADRLAEAGEWIVDCATAADFLARVEGSRS